MDIKIYCHGGCGKWRYQDPYAPRYHCGEYCPGIQKKPEIEQNKQKIEQKTPKIEQKSTIPLNYTYHQITIGAHNISAFQGPENRRRLSSAQVKSLHGLLQRNGHFDSPLVLNQKDNVNRVLDGNHRIEAIARIINRKPTFTIDTLCVIYQDLGEDDEIAIFKRWNVGRPQSMDDFLQSIAKKYAILKKFMSEVPIKITIYKQKDSITLRNVLNALIAANNRDENGSALRRENFIKEIEGLTKNDLAFIQEFFMRHREHCGDPRPKCTYFTPIVLNALMYIQKELPGRNIPKAFADIKDDKDVQHLCQYTNRTANKDMLGMIKRKLGLKTKL